MLVNFADVPHEQTHVAAFFFILYTNTMSDVLSKSNTFALSFLYEDFQRVSDSGGEILTLVPERSTHSHLYYSSQLSLFDSTPPNSAEHKLNRKERPIYVAWPHTDVIHLSRPLSSARPNEIGLPVKLLSLRKRLSEPIRHRVSPPFM